MADGKKRTGPGGTRTGLLVEQFGLFDNLMIEGGIIDSGGDRWCATIRIAGTTCRCSSAASRRLQRALATEH